MALRRPPDSADPNHKEWLSFKKRDQEALESGSSLNLSRVPIEFGRYFAFIPTRELKAVYWQEPTWRIVRASWFFRDQNDKVCPFGEADAATIEEAAEDIAAGREDGPIDVELVDTEGGGIVQVAKRLKVVESAENAAGTATSGAPSESTPTVLPSSMWSSFWPATNSGRSSTPQHAALPSLTFAYYLTTSDGVPRRLHVVRGYPLSASTASEDEDTLHSHDDPRGLGTQLDQLHSPPRWLIFVTHGIGEALLNRQRDGAVGALRFRKKIAELRQTLNKVAKARAIGAVNAKRNSEVSSRIELIPIEWLGATQSPAMQKALERVALPTLETARDFVNLAVRDVLLYTQPDWKDRVLNETRKQINEKFLAFCEHNPGFHDLVKKGEAGVAFLGHSLGAVILTDLLLQDESSKDSDRSLVIRPSVLFMLGSPVGLFRCVRGDYVLPRLPAKVCFNIFHPHDPIAYRIEPLIGDSADSTREAAPSRPPSSAVYAPASVPYRGGHRLHVAISRFGTSLLNWWSGGNPEENEAQGIISSNGGFRIDWTLQASAGEAASEWLSAVSSHFTYWTHEDVIEFVVDKLGEVGEKEKVKREFI